MSELTNYKYVRIGREDLHFFVGLDPFEKLNLLYTPFGFALGVLADSKEELLPVGLLVGTAAEEMLTVEWLGIDPDYRFQGLGEQLLVRVFDMARDVHVEQVAAVFPLEYGKEKLDGAKSYFAERLFTSGECIPADACYTLDTLWEKMGLQVEEDQQIPNLSLMTMAQRRACIKKLAAMDSALCIYTPGDVESAIDYDCSIVMTKDQKTAAALLVLNCRDVLMPVYYYAKSQKLGEELMQHALSAAMAKYGKGVKVFLMARQSESYAVLQHFLGDVEQEELWVAKVEDYTDMNRKNGWGGRGKELIRLTEENVSEYADFLTEDVAENIHRMLYRGLVVTEEEVPIGGMVWELQHVSGDGPLESHIIWFIAGQEEVATMLFDEYGAMIDEDHVVKSTFTLPAKAGKAEKQMLMEAGFSVGLSEGDEIHARLSEIAKIPLIAGARISDEVHPLTLVSQRGFNNVIQRMISNGIYGRCEDLAHLPRSYFENDVSCYAENDGVMIGLFLFHLRPSGRLEISLLGAIGQVGVKMLPQLMALATKSAMEKYPPETEVVVDRHNYASLALGEKLFPSGFGVPIYTGERTEKEE